MPKFQRFIAAALAGSMIVGSVSLGHAQTAGEPSAPSTQPPSTLSKIENTLVDYLQRGMNLFSATVEAVVPYKAPEVLPNGDIIIRRSQEAPKTGPSGTTTPSAPAAPPAPAGTDDGRLKT